MVELSNVPIMDYTDNETGCCPRFHPEDWDEKYFKFDGMRFIKASTRSFMYMPLNMNRIMSETMEAIQKAGSESKERYLILSQDISKWRCDHLFLIDGDVPGYESQSLEGTYFAKVYDGAFKEMPKWIQDFNKKLASNNLATNNLYTFYTTCPECSKHYGHNYVVLFGRIS